MKAKKAIAVYQADIERGNGKVETSHGQRNFCSHCATVLWLYDSRWPNLIHPFVSNVDTPLPNAPERVHLMLAFKSDWVVADIGPKDQSFDKYPEQSIEAWHRSRGLWID